MAFHNEPQGTLPWRSLLLTGSTQHASMVSGKDPGRGGKTCFQGLLGKSCQELVTLWAAIKGTGLHVGLVFV